MSGCYVGGVVFVWAWVFQRGVIVLSGRIGPGTSCIMSVAAPGDDDLDSGEAWVMRVCLGRRG